MIKTYTLSAIMIATLAEANTLKDADLDGVPDSIDACAHTPFLHEVDSRGCTINILTLPQDSEKTHFTFSIGYGYSTNEDLVGRETQQITKAQLSYYHDTWSYTLKTGYFTQKEEEGAQDTILKVQKRLTLDSKTKLYLGTGVKLPSYDFQGNKTDYTLYTSLIHYKTPKHSYFTGVNYTFIQDKPDKIPLHNSFELYLGSGYFFTHNFYADFSYSLMQSKFRDAHMIHTLSSTLFYQINQKLFTTLHYNREIGDEDLHDGLSLKLGISF